MISVTRVGECRLAKAGRVSGDNAPLIQRSLVLPQDEVDRYLQSEQRNPSYTIQVCSGNS